MSSREIVLWLDERWYDALERHIKGETLQEKLDNYLDELCNNLLPDYEYEQISREIYEERKARDELREADRRFAVFKVTERNEQSLFLVDEPLDFLLAAKALRRYLRGANAATNFRHYYAAAQEITAGEFTRYANERQENTGRVCGMFEIDFDRGQMAGLKIDDGWVWFKLKDVSAAAYQSERKRGLTTDDRWERFLAALDGKEINPDVSLHGTRSLCAEDVSFSGEINEGDLRLNFYMDAFDGVDEVLGTHVCTTENGDYVNIYAEYDLLGGEVCDKLLITLCRGNGMDDDYEYELSPKEKEMLLGKMDAYCQNVEGMSIAEWRERILRECDEESQTGLQPREGKGEENVTAGEAELTSLAERLAEFFQTYNADDYGNMSRQELAAKTQSQLNDQLYISETIGEIELTIPEETMTSEQAAEAHALIHELVALLPECLQQEYEDNCGGERAGLTMG